MNTDLSDVLTDVSIRVNVDLTDWLMYLYVLIWTFLMVWMLYLYVRIPTFLTVWLMYLYVWISTFLAVWALCIHVDILYIVSCIYDCAPFWPFDCFTCTCHYRPFGRFHCSIYHYNCIISTFLAAWLPSVLVIADLSDGLTFSYTCDYLPSGQFTKVFLSLHIDLSGLLNFLSDKRKALHNIKQRNTQTLGYVSYIYFNKIYKYNN